MIVNVGLKHIAGGFKSNPWSCPVALAIAESTNEPYVSVGPYRVKFSPYELGQGLPDKVVNFIAEFDEGLPVTPFNFHI